MKSIPFKQLILIDKLELFNLKKIPEEKNDFYYHGKPELPLSVYSRRLANFK